MKNKLRSLGFGEKEIAVFETVTKLGTVSPTEVANVTGINRTTVYAVAKDLIQRGVITEDLSAKKYTLQRVDPDTLRVLLDPIRRDLQEKEHIITDLIGELKQNMKEQDIVIPKVSFIHQDQIERYLYIRTPIWNQSLLDSGEDYSGFLDYTFTEMYQDWITWYWDQPSSNSIRLRLITNESEFEKNTMTRRFDERRHIEFWEGAGEITYSSWTNGNYTILINTRKRPFYLIEIMDENYAHSQRQVFEALWREVIQKNSEEN